MVVVREPLPVGLVSGTDLVSYPNVGLCLLSQLGHLPGHPPKLLYQHILLYMYMYMCGNNIMIVSSC